MKNNNLHAALSFGCPTNGHGAFRVEDKRWICDCGEDFTDNMQQLKDFITFNEKSSK